MSLVRQRVAEAIARHGSIRAAARVLQVDSGYLLRLRDGTKGNPSDSLLRKLGLRRVVTIEDATKEKP